MQTIRNEIERRLPHRGAARRLFHGRGQAFEGLGDLVIDHYPPVVQIVLYRQRPDAWIDSLRSLILDAIPDTEAIILQMRYEKTAPSRLLWGELPAEVDAVEDGLRFRLRLAEAQNIGFFPDMAVGRSLLRQRASGKRVLNLFSYTCSFSVAALAGGAKEVVNVDMNRGALELGRFNHQLNDIDLRRCSFLNLDIFKSFSRLRRLGPFDIVVCDPPSAQGRSFTAERHWPKLIRHLRELLSERGEVFACLNAPHLPSDFLIEHFEDSLPDAELSGIYLPGDDYPEAEKERGVALLHYILRKEN